MRISAFSARFDRNAFEQVAPVSRAPSAFVRTPDEKRAVILIHGLLPHPINDTHVSTPSLSGWEKPGSTLVTTLGAANDVYSLGYGQNAPIDDIATVADASGQCQSVAGDGVS